VNPKINPKINAEKMLKKRLITHGRPSILTLYRGASKMNFLERGPVAQLGARFNRTEEAEGSNPSRSIQASLIIDINEGP
jgi:hypothetical protein